MAKNKRPELRNKYIEIEIGNEIERIQNQRKRTGIKFRLKKQDIQDYLGITKHQLKYWYETEGNNQKLMERLKAIKIKDMMQFMVPQLCDYMDSDRTKYTNNTNKKHDKSK